MLPEHPPEILCGLGQWSLRGDVGLLLPATNIMVLRPAPGRWEAAVSGGQEGWRQGPHAAGSRADNAVAGDRSLGLAMDSGAGMSLPST